jgi:predicted secreted hydrolase
MIKMDVYAAAGERFAPGVFTDVVGKPATWTVGGQAWLGRIWSANMADDGTEATLAIEVEDPPPA